MKEIIIDKHKGLKKNCMVSLLQVQNNYIGDDKAGKTHIDPVRYNID